MCMESRRVWRVACCLLLVACCLLLSLSTVFSFYRQCAVENGRYCVRTTTFTITLCSADGKAPPEHGLSAVSHRTYSKQDSRRRPLKAAICFEPTQPTLSKPLNKRSSVSLVFPFHCLCVFFFFLVWVQEDQ